MDARRILNQLDDKLAARPKTHRQVVAGAASMVAHAIAIAAIAFLLPGMERPHRDWVLAYFVDFDQGRSAASGEGSLDAHEPGALPKPRSSSNARPLARGHHRSSPPKVEANDDAGDKMAALNPAALKPGTDRVTEDRDAIGRSANPSGAGSTAKTDQIPASASSDAVTGGDSSGARSGFDEEAGGGASRSARVAYGQNPAPRYPATARRLDQQGTVVLRVLVDADGAVARVEVIHSSGFDSLDDSAIETVRTRWRFLPARREGVSVASWAEVPIRFALTEANAN